MNRFLLIASTLAILGNFGDCAPSKKPSKSKQIEILDYDDFNDDVAKVAALYATNTPEDLFLDALAGIIQKTFLPTEQLINYVEYMVNANIAQIKLQNNKDKTLIMNFPDDKKIADLISQKDILTQKLIELRDRVTPTTDINKQLWTMLAKDMDRNTKIERKVFDKLKAVAVEIVTYTNLSEKHFQKLQMPKYMEHLDDIIATIGRAKYRKISPKMADERINKNIAELNAIFPDMKKAMDFALKMNYDGLHEGQQKFRDIVMKTLGVEMFFGEFSIKKDVLDRVKSK